jgi:hypothetical protein
MTVSRRDFMKVFGISVASLLLTRCRFPIGVTCYAPLPPTALPDSTRDRLRLCWLSFNELAQKTIEEAKQGSTENTFGQQLVADHRAALDELVASGELTPSIADLIQEAYAAAVYHVWRSNAPMTCYAAVVVDYAPISAGVLVQQAEALSQAASQASIDPETFAKAQAALEHDMAYYALSDADVQALYDRLISDWQANGQSIPSFETLELEPTSDAKAAAQFILDLMTGK